MDISNKFNNFFKESEINEIIGTNIQIFSNKKMIIEGCYGINEYNSDMVRINLPKGEFLIFGSNLEIRNMQDKTVTVCGILNSFEFVGETL